MGWFRQLLSRRRIYDDLSAEIREHLKEKIDELVAGGMSRKDASAAARREFGNLNRRRQPRCVGLDGHRESGEPGIAPHGSRVLRPIALAVRE